MVALGFALYGGTAIALRLGHRPSVDFDFFSETPLDRGAIRSALPFVGRARVLQDERDAWTMLVPSEAGERPEVRVSFFGSIDFGRVGEPELTSDGVVVAAFLAVLAAVPHAEYDHGIGIDSVADDVGAPAEGGQDLAQVGELVVFTGATKLRMTSEHVSSSPNAADRPLSGRDVLSAEELAHSRESA